MRTLALASLLTIVACGPLTTTGPSPGPPSHAPSTSSERGAEPASAEPPPAAASAEPSPAAPSVEPPAVTVEASIFPILETLALREIPIEGGTEDAARHGIERYLEALDRYRDSGFDATQLGITGRFRDAVIAGLTASATPGVRRKFEIESIRVLRRSAKPWGTQAFVDVSVALADRAIDGGAPPQRETGVLRLAGDRRSSVVDAWDGTRWFNGGGERLDAARVRGEVAAPISFYLRLESWIPGMSPEAWRTGDEATTFTVWRAQRLAAIDRAQVASRTFERVVATVERFETFAEITSGLATVRLAGTLVTEDAAGRAMRTAFERRVRVFVFGNWLPEVVDEEIAPGEWASGGELALEKVDIDRA